MPRLINPQTFDGADMEDSKHGLRLVIWNKDGHRRYAHELTGDEAAEAIVEIKDMLAGLSEDGEAGAKPARKKRGA